MWTGFRPKPRSTESLVHPRSTEILFPDPLCLGRNVIVGVGKGAWIQVPPPTGPILVVRTLGNSSIPLSLGFFVFATNTSCKASNGLGGSQIVGTQ